MNLPNILTLSRIGLAFVFMYFFFSPGVGAKSIAILIFLLASLTDYWDGYLARKMNLITNFGKLIDPVADKLLVLAAFLAFVEMKLMPSWMAIIIIARELLITGVRILSLVNGKVIPAMRAGKHKTISQFFAITFILIFILVREIMLKNNLWNNFWENSFQKVVFFLLLIATLFTLISGISFLYYHRDYFLEKRT